MTGCGESTQPSTELLSLGKGVHLAGSKVSKRLWAPCRLGLEVEDECKYCSQIMTI